jgi:hypothetical protein
MAYAFSAFVVVVHFCFVLFRQNYITKSGLKLKTFLPLSLEFWDCGYVPPCLTSALLLGEKKTGGRKAFLHSIFIFRKKCLQIELGLRLGLAA